MPALGSDQRGIVSNFKTAILYQCYQSGVAGHFLGRVKDMGSLQLTHHISTEDERLVEAGDEAEVVADRKMRFRAKQCMYWVV